MKDKDYLEVRQGTKGEKKILNLYDCIPIEKMIVLNYEEIKLIYDIKVNGIKTYDNLILKEEDQIEYNEIKTVFDLIDYLNLDRHKYILYKDNKQLDLNYRLKNGDVLEAKSSDEVNDKEIRLIINEEEKIIHYNKKKLVFVDIFNYIDFDLTKPKGKLILKLNGRDAQYMETLSDGDKVNVYWENY